MTCRHCDSPRTVGHGRNRRACRDCGRTWTLVSARLAGRVRLPGSWPGPITRDDRGRLRIFLGKDHPAANSGGWQWLARFVIWRSAGVALPRGLHVHHRDEQLDNNWLENLDVLTAAEHGRIHGKATVHYRRRDARGRFVPMPEGLGQERRAA